MCSFEPRPLSSLQGQQRLLYQIEIKFDTDVKLGKVPATKSMLRRGQLDFYEPQALSHPLS